MNSINTLIFIPDISGFTNFVNQTEIDHSSHIISELIELIINQNKLGLHVSEIEGDSVLFYKSGAVPKIETILIQAETMFTAFHRYLKRYDSERICRCGACSTAINLNLKFVVHSGPVKQIKTGNRAKLHGKTVILAHRLLKNQIKSKAYILFSDAFSDSINHIDHDKIPHNYKFSFDEAAYPGFDRIKFIFTDLSNLKSKVPDLPFKGLSRTGSHHIHYQLTVDRPADSVYENISDLSKRAQWHPKIKKILNQEKYLLSAGSTHACLIGNNELDIMILGRFEKDHLIEYGERTNDLFIFNHISAFYTLKEDNHSTYVSLEMDYELKKIFIFLRPLVRIRFFNQLKQTLFALKKYSEETS